MMLTNEGEILSSTTASTFAEKQTQVCPEGPCVELDIGDLTAGPGEEISLPVYVGDVTGRGVEAFEMEICWCENPAGVLEYLGCSAGEVVMNAGWPDPVCNPSAETCVLIAGAGAVELSGSGPLFYLNFRVDPGAVAGCCDVPFVSANLFAANPVELCIQDGSVCVEHCFHVALGDTTFANPGENIQVPVTIENVTDWDIMAFDMEICWCGTPSGLLEYIGCLPGEVLIQSGWGDPACNECADTCVTVAAAGSDGLTGGGVLFYLEFHVSVNAKPCMCCDLEFTYVNLYDPENPLSVCPEDGQVCIEWCDIEGYVTNWYCEVDACGDTLRTHPLSGVRVHLWDCTDPIATTYTDATGYYLFECLDPIVDNCYYCTDVSCAQVPDGITAYDAALILQYLVCLDDLEDCWFWSGGMVHPQKVAADVTCDGSITSYDASLILQYAVNKIVAFPCPSFWAWYPIPENCAFECPGVIDWIGVLRGDVSGPLGPPAPAPLNTVIVMLGDGTDYGERIEVPISVQGASGIVSSDFGLSYSTDELYVISAAPAGLSAGSMSAYNAASGNLALAMAGSQPYAGDGDVATITFGKVTPDADLSSVLITSATLNNGFPPAEIAGPAGVEDIPGQHVLGPAIPNPFTQGTHISYSMVTSGAVRLEIYNVSGQLVCVLYDGYAGPGDHRVHWDGRDDEGVPVARGVYFCCMETEGFRATRKVVLVK
jgi:hypothetical protein